jgi:hypothetical protein
MTTVQKDPKRLQSLRELQESIDQAVKKIRGARENDICKFLPSDKGGYIHHFTLRKMKGEDPDKLQTLISTYILRPDKPRRVAHKPRRPRGSRKKTDLIALTRGELDRLLGHLRHAGDQEMAAKLSPRKSLAQIKRQLNTSIRKNEIDHEAWNSYCEAIIAQSASTDRDYPVAKQIMVTPNG